MADIAPRTGPGTRHLSLSGLQDYSLMPRGSVPREEVEKVSWVSKEPCADTHIDALPEQLQGKGGKIPQKALVWELGGFSGG